MRPLGLSSNITGSGGVDVGAAWEAVRGPVLVPALRAAVYVCAAMSLMLFVERVYMAAVVVGVRLLGRRRYTRYRLDAVRQEVEAAATHPMVLVQIPMFNEKQVMHLYVLPLQVYRLSIGAACGMAWPSDKIVIQVLDDSTDPVIRELVELECQRWASKGVNIKYENRSNRNGYKAGALREGLKKHYAKDCQFVTIFDADFQPESDFLWRTIPFLLANPELALAQARWKFVNADECLLTRIQEMSLDYHFGVEQEVGSSMYSFFGFNGTAGVWRIQALADAGGWKDRTTVEDMDLAVRASLRGWKFIFVGDLWVKNELPSTFKAYRYQQHRWSCGPANLFRKMFKEIIFCERVSPWKKFHVIYAFFFVRKIVAHFVTFFFYCVIIPACVLVPEVHLPKYIAIYVPSIITILNAISTPRSFHLLIFWILFENVMSMHRTKATIIGLMEANRVNEWVVTEKLGTAASKHKASTPKLSKKPRFRFGDRSHVLEILMGVYLMYCAIYDIMFGRDRFYIYLLLQAGAAFIMGFGYVGTFVPT